MKERKETISIGIANLLSLALLAAAVVLFGGIYWAMWGFGETWEYLMDGPSWAFPVSLLELMVAMLACTVIHELIHGLVWALFAKDGFRSISFGVMWKYMAPYCHCSEPLKVHHYQWGAAAPLIILGIIPALMAIPLKSVFLLSLSIIMISGAAGDIMVIWKTRKEKPTNLLLDHPTEAGYMVYEKD